MVCLLHRPFPFAHLSSDHHSRYHTRSRLRIWGCSSSAGRTYTLRHSVNSAARTQSSLGGSRERTRARDLLVGVEIALSVVLVVGAVLLMRSHVRRLQQSPASMTTESLQYVVLLPSQKYATDEQQAAFYGMLQDKLRAIARRGIRQRSRFGPVPLDGTIGGKWIFHMEDQATSAATGQFTMVHAIQPGYMQSLHIPIVRGRDVALTDRDPAENVALVNQAFATRYFAGADIVGRRSSRFGEGLTAPPIRIVGVVRDFRHERPPAELMPAILRIARNDIPLGNVRAAHCFVRCQFAGSGDSRHHARARSDTGRGSSANANAGGRARLLARAPTGQSRGCLCCRCTPARALWDVRCVVLRGRAAHTGVGHPAGRGCSSNQLLGLALAQGARVALIGIVAGIVAALALSRVLTGLLYDVRPADPITFVGVAVALLIVALLAALLPALRAARLDPLTAIRWN